MMERDKTSLHRIANFLEFGVSDLGVVAKLLDSALEDNDTNSAIWLNRKLKDIHQELEKDIRDLYEFKAAMNKAKAA